MKNKNSRKYVIVSQKFYPSQIGEIAMFCVVVKDNKIDDLFEFIVNNGGRVISAIPCQGLSKNSIIDIVNGGYASNSYLVVSVCQKEIVDVLMMNLCKAFELNHKGNGKAFVIDVLGYMGAKGTFVE